MSRSAGRLGSPQAAREIADVCAELVRRRWGSTMGRASELGRKPVRPPDLAS
jgi:UDP-N-acetylglucosamine--N-acetylmuramyl-(pentapeptide) pyrophosphoryl-undecaprenol N-acetylglucosamine transferase